MCTTYKKHSLEQRRCEDNATMHGEKKSPWCNNAQLNTVMFNWRFEMSS